MKNAGLIILKNILFTIRTYLSRLQNTLEFLPSCAPNLQTLRPLNKSFLSSQSLQTLSSLDNTLQSQLSIAHCVPTTRWTLC